MRNCEISSYPTDFNNQPRRKRDKQFRNFAFPQFRNSRRRTPRSLLIILAEIVANADLDRMADLHGPAPDRRASRGSIVYDAPHLRST